MVRTALAILPLLLVSLPVRAADPALFRSAAGGYSVRFPAPPAESVKRKASGAKHHLAVAGEEMKGRAWLVTWMDYFPDALADPSQALQEIAKGFLGAGGRFVSEGEARFAGLPGRAFQVAQPDGVGIHGRVVIRPDARIYAVVAMGKGIADAELKPYFASFRLDGPGVPDLPEEPAAARAVFPEAGVSLAFHGKPERVDAGTDAKGQEIRGTRPRGGLRTELATFAPFVVKSEEDRSDVLDGVVKGFRGKAGGVDGVRVLKVAGRPARDFGVAMGTKRAFCRAIAYERGVLILQLVGLPGAVSPKEAVAFFETLRFEKGR